MTITAFPINTIPPTANLIGSTPSGFVTATNVQAAINQLAVGGPITASAVSNVPSGIITATDVQAALNQLAAAISVGSGGDPLFLTQGMDLTTFNPTFGGNSTDRYSLNIRQVTDYSTNDPLFGNNNAAQFGLYSLHGQNTNGARTQAKATFICSGNDAIHRGAGQKFNTGNSMISYAMGDTATWAQNFVEYWGGPINGDEGQGWGLFSALRQGNALARATISSVPTPAVINTTTTQSITANKTAQTVNVVNASSLANGDWVVIEQEIPRADPNLEAVKVISHTATSITGVFVYNHASGVTVTPALRLFVSDLGRFGQDRFIINLTRTPVTGGTVSSISGGGFIGTGTSWTIGMVGGNATNIGAVSLTNDNFTEGPFAGGAGPLKAWYQIGSVGSTTTLGIYKTTVAGAGDYIGRGVGSGAYTIRPCAKVLRLVNNGNSLTGEIICETSTSTWSAGDAIEQVICCYPDVSGFQYSMGCWTPGALLRRFLGISNAGGRMVQNGIEFMVGFYNTGPTSDPLEWGNEIDMTGPPCANNIVCDKATIAAIAFPCSTDIAGRLTWHGGAGFQWLGPNSANSGMTWLPISPANDVRGHLDFIQANTGLNPSNLLPAMSWGGSIYLPSLSSSGFPSGFFRIDNVTSDLTNFEYGFMRWVSNDFEIGTQKGGTGAVHDMVLKTNNVEQIRLVAGGTVKFSAAPSFSANGSVATVLGSLGPAGSHTAVQKWLTIVDNTGATLYIPAF